MILKSFFRVPVAVVVLAILSLHSARSVGSPPEESIGLRTLLEGDHATGNWWGHRDAWKARGVDLFGNYTAEIWGNVSGGEKRGVVYTGLLAFGATLDLESLVGWPGASVHNNWLWLSGKDPSEALLGGDLFGASNIAGYNTFRMFELWFQQTVLDEALSLRLGQLAADQEFAVSEYAGLFLNGTFGFPLALTASLPNGGPQYPLATPGVRLELKPAEWFRLRTAAFQGDPFAQEVNRHGFHYQFSDEVGALLLNEAEFAWQRVATSRLPGTFKAGFWYHTGKFADPGDNSVMRNGNTGFYFVLEQALYRPATAQEGKSFPADTAKAGPSDADVESGQRTGLGTFSRFAFEPGDRNVISFYADAGLVYQGLLPGRPDDSVGIAFGYGKLSSGARNTLRTDGALEPGDSFVVEATYQVQVTPWLVVQPDLQYIIRPGGTGDFGDALLVGIRSTVEF